MEYSIPKITLQQMEYSTPQSALQEVETTDVFFGNTLLLMAILLFLAVLPRALRYILLQKESAVEELELAAEEKTKKETLYEKPVPPKDRSIAYLMEDSSASPKTREGGGIPPFPAEEEKENEEKEKKVKIIKEGVPISHNEVEEPPPVPKKKVKLIKQEFSISPGENKVPSKRAPSELPKGKKSGAPVKDPKPKVDDAPPISGREKEESDSNWVEAEIPGLIIEPLPAEEKPESIPTFKSSPKTQPQSKAGKPQKPPHKEKQGEKVKNIAPKSEEKKDSRPKKQMETKPTSPKLKMEISGSKPKAVEKRAPVVSHKNIAKKEAEKGKPKVPSSKAGKTQKTKAGVKAVPPQREKIKTSPERAKPKPFLLDLKYLDQEESAHPVAREKSPADKADMMIARLIALQVDLENQLVSMPGELTPRENPVNGNTRKNRIQDSLSVNESSDKKEVSLDELDSFLFTSTQRKK